MFHVGETSGDLVLTTSPDREERDTYILRIKVGTPIHTQDQGRDTYILRIGIGTPTYSG